MKETHMTQKSRFALFFGNRGFFPASLQAEAREELPRVLEAAGHEVLMLEAEATRYGAVETPQEGQIFANILRQNQGKFDGVILSLPNFGDENGAVAALKEAGVPILIQAYPDEFDRMGPALRRDAFCGKFSIMDVFYQHNLKYTALKPHVVHPSSERFKANLDHFDRLCRVVKGFRHLVVGAIGARTTAFKTVRFDEVALQRVGVTVETFDLSNVIARVKTVPAQGSAYKEKREALQAYTSWEGIPAAALDNITRLGVVLDEIIAEYQMDAIAIRCWIELQQQLGISPCVLLGLLNNTGTIAACEVDVCNAVAMAALSLASGRPATVLDWNNNYGEEDDKCILFHCGPVPSDLMTNKGHVSDHLILGNAVGENHGFGCVVGRIAPSDLTFSSMMTDSGRVKVYLGEGRFTEDPIPENFFGAAGVAEIAGLQDVLLHVGLNGYRHHVGVTTGKYVAPIHEAMEKYLGFDVSIPQAE
jgi:L-fucose isomerase-like protein